LNDRLRADARAVPALAAIVLVFGLLARGDATLIQAATYAGIYAIAAIGLSLLLGNANQVSIGQAGFFGIGAYAVAYLTTTWNVPPVVSWPLAALIGMGGATLVGFGLGYIALRFRGHYLAMATLAFGLIFYGLVHEAQLFGGVSGINGVPFAKLGGLTLSGYPAYWFVWAFAFIAAFATLNVLRSPSGTAFETIRNDELAAETIGVPTRRYKIVAFAYAGALAGLSGAIFASFLGLIVPDAVGLTLSIDLLLMVVLGGSGTVTGALLGALLIGFIDVSGHEFENWRQVAYGLLVIAVVIVAPGGLMGALRRMMPRAKRSDPPAARPAAPQARERVAQASGTALAVSGATKRFGGIVAVDDVSFVLTAGTLTSLIGPNGAGKTTLFNAISGIGRLSSGTIRIAGSDAGALRPHEIAALGVGRTFQNARLFSEMTVLENVVAGAFRVAPSRFAADVLGLPVSRRKQAEATDRARAALARLDLEHLAGTVAKDLAFGDRRRVEVARAIAADPWLLLLDEPAAGLNAAERRRLQADLLALRDAGMTLLLIEHDMRLVMSLSERVLVLKFGSLIADGDPATVRADREVIAAYLGTAS
jgi:branched-chain amino acid transport system permease protein